jgi:hypothetical protein
MTWIATPSLALRLAMTRQPEETLNEKYNPGITRFIAWIATLSLAPAMTDQLERTWL